MLTATANYGPGDAIVQVPVGGGNHRELLRFEPPGVNPIVVFGDFTEQQREEFVKHVARFGVLFEPQEATEDGPTPD